MPGAGIWVTPARAFHSQRGLPRARGSQFPFSSSPLLPPARLRGGSTAPQSHGIDLHGDIPAVPFLSRAVAVHPRCPLGPSLALGTLLASAPLCSRAKSCSGGQQGLGMDLEPSRSISAAPRAGSSAALDRNNLKCAAVGPGVSPPCHSGRALSLWDTPARGPRAAQVPIQPHPGKESSQAPIPPQSRFQSAQGEAPSPPCCCSKGESPARHERRTQQTPKLPSYYRVWNLCAQPRAPLPFPLTPSLAPGYPEGFQPHSLLAPGPGL